MNARKRVPKRSVDRGFLRVLAELLVLLASILTFWVDRYGLPTSSVDVQTVSKAPGAAGLVKKPQSKGRS